MNWLIYGCLGGGVATVVISFGLQSGAAKFFFQNIFECIEDKFLHEKMTTPSWSFTPSSLFTIILKAFYSIFLFVRYMNV